MVHGRVAAGARARGTRTDVPGDPRGAGGPRPCWSMSRQEGSAAEKGIDDIDETANPLGVADQERMQGQKSLAPSGRRWRAPPPSLRKMPEGSNWPNTYPWFSNDGCTFASGHHTALNELLLTDVHTGESNVGVRCTGNIKTTCLAPDGVTFCVAGDDGIAVYRLEESAKRPLNPTWQALAGTTIIDAAFSRDGKHLASVQNKSGLLQVWNMESGSTEPIFELGNFTVGWEGDSFGISYSDDLLAIGGRREFPSEKRVRVLQVASMYKEQEVELELEGHVRNAIFNPSGTQLVVSMDWSQNEKLRKNSLVRVFRTDDWGASPMCLPNPFPDVWNASSARFSNDGRLVVLGYHSNSKHGIY
eukprot:COSAG02_NODE_13528_length_1383_cov_0.925234_1_plen_359_part_10